MTDMRADNLETIGKDRDAAKAARDVAPRAWARHARATFALALPLIGVQLATVAMGVTDTVMIGWLGADELAASVLATQAFFLVYIFGAGFAQAALPLAASAEGRGDVRGVRRSIRMGLWALALYAAATMPGLWRIETILLALGQEPEISRLAGAYMAVALWALPPAHSGASDRGFRRHPIADSGVSDHPDLPPLSVVRDVSGPSSGQAQRRPSPSSIGGPRARRGVPISGLTLRRAREVPVDDGGGRRGWSGRS